MSLGLILALLIIIPIALFVHWVCRTCRRRKLIEKPLPTEWMQIIERNIALYRYLPDGLKKPLHGYLQILLAEKHFEGCGGVELTDEMKVTVCTQAAILLLGRPKPTYFPKAVSILIYPSAYVAHQTSRDGYIETQEHSVRLGESWVQGIVVLAWDQVKRHAETVGNGHNVVLHEFAHQLDQETGGSTGTPVLESHARYDEWGKVMSKEYDRLRDRAIHHHGDVMDAYGATNPAEFFAVATETFFDNPHALKRAHAKLYEELKDYYRLDPAQWIR